MSAISEYLNDRVTAFGFDDRINEIATKSEDQTVRGVVDALWFHYDDCKDHYVVLSKEEWDYIQRLLLILDSDSQIYTSQIWCWSRYQAIAIATLACFGVLLWGFDLSYWFVAIPFGFLSMGISFLRERAEPRPGIVETAHVPFASFGELRNARRRSPNFRKQRYPARLAHRRIRGPVAARLGAIPSHILWLFASPFVLLVQALPDSQVESHVLAN